MAGGVMTDPTKYARDVQFFTAIRDSDDDKQSGRGVVTVLALSFAFMLGFAAGYAFGDVPTMTVDHEICTERGC